MDANVNAKFNRKTSLIQHVRTSKSASSKWYLRMQVRLKRNPNEDSKLVDTRLNHEPAEISATACEAAVPSGESL